MKLHNNWEVSDAKLKKLQEMDEAALMATIERKNLFAGLPTEYAKAQNKLIYGKINPTGAKEEIGTSDTPKDKKRNGKDNKKGSEPSK